MSVGSGVPAESAEENVSVIGAPPLAWRVPPAGDTDSSVSGPGGGADWVTGLVTGLLSPALTIFTWPDAWAEVAANALPAMMTAAAAPAVSRDHPVPQQRRADPAHPTSTPQQRHCSVSSTASQIPVTQTA